MATPSILTDDRVIPAGDPTVKSTAVGLVEHPALFGAMIKVELPAELICPNTLGVVIFIAADVGEAVLTIDQQLYASVTEGRVNIMSRSADSSICLRTCMVPPFLPLGNYKGIQNDINNATVFITD